MFPTKIIAVVVKLTYSPSYTFSHSFKPSIYKVFVQSMYTHLKSTCIVANLINMLTLRNSHDEYGKYIYASTG